MQSKNNICLLQKVWISVTKESSFNFNKSGHRDVNLLIVPDHARKRQAYVLLWSSKVPMLDGFEENPTDRTCPMTEHALISPMHNFKSISWIMAEFLYFECQKEDLVQNGQVRGHPDALLSPKKQTNIKRPLFTSFQGFHHFSISNLCPVSNVQKVYRATFAFLVKICR